MCGFTLPPATGVTLFRRATGCSGTSPLSPESDIIKQNVELSVHLQERKKQGETEERPISDSAASLPSRGWAQRGELAVGHRQDRARCLRKQASGVQLRPAEGKPCVAVIIVFNSTPGSEGVGQRICQEKLGFSCLPRPGSWQEGCGTTPRTGGGHLQAACFSQAHVSDGLPGQPRTSEQERPCTPSFQGGDTWKARDQRGGY